MTALLVTAGACACSPSVSRTPLKNSTPEGAEQYFYGPALVTERKPQAAPALTALRPKAPKPKPVVAKVAPKESVHVPSVELADGGVPDTHSAIAVGDYRGSDRVTIRIPGVPKSTEDDDKARARVEDNEDGTFTVSVLDSNTGDDLCALDGKAKGSHIEFDPGQSCFEDVLGFEATTELAHGGADVTSDTLSVRFVVTLTGDSDAEGSLDYQFDGKRQ